MKRRPLIIVTVIAALALVGSGAWWFHRKHAQNTGTGLAMASAAGSTVAGGPADASEVVALSPPPDRLEPAFWLDVLQPHAVHQALLDNAWLKETADQPLGRGFLGPWAVFFGTRAKDIGASFNGRVLNLFLDAMETPYRVLWLSGETSAQVPVILIPEAASSALASLDLLVKVAGKGGFSPQGCPVQEAGDGGDAGVPDAGSVAAAASAPAESDGGVPPPAPGLATIQRIVLGDRALFVAHQGGRAFISMRPTAVLQGMCLPAFTLPHADSAAELGVALGENGRALQSLASILGMKGEARLRFGLSGSSFTPLGLGAAATQRASLGSSSLDASLLKLIPHGTGVFVSLTLALPEKLDATAFQAVLAGKPASGKTVPRQIVVLWDPRGSLRLPTEVAVIWSRTEDADFIATIASRTHPLLSKTLCGHLVLASTDALLRSIESSCAGSLPSIASGTPALVQGLQAPSSVALNVDLGSVLPRLLNDGYDPGVTDGGVAVPPLSQPPELGAAQKQLEPLPFLHWQALVNDQGQWTPGGFRS